MDYYSIYNRFISDFMNTPIRCRIRRRDPNDPRLNDEIIYAELHHIIPKSLGGDNSHENLIALTPEEHIFIHYLRWKIFGYRQDLFGVNMMINGFFNKANLNHITLNKVARKKFRLAREEFARLIKVSNKGHPAISAARRGTMPVKDAATGVIIGSVPVDHEKIKSGAWVHATKGRKASTAERKAVKARVTGVGNPNSSGLSDEDYIKQAAEYIKTIEDGRFTWKDYREYCESKGIVYLKSFSANRFSGSRLKFLEELSRFCLLNSIPYKYDQFYRGNKKDA